MTEKRIAIILEADGRAVIATFDGATGAVERMDDATEKLNRTAARNAAQAEKSGAKWREFGRTLGQGALVGATALGFLLRSQINTADATEEMAARIGVSTEFISEMDFVAKMAAGDNSFFGSQPEPVGGQFGESRARAQRAIGGVQIPGHRRAGCR